MSLLTRIYPALAVNIYMNCYRASSYARIGHAREAAYCEDQDHESRALSVHQASMQIISYTCTFKYVFSRCSLLCGVKDYDTKWGTPSHHLPSRPHLAPSKPRFSLPAGVPLQGGDARRGGDGGLPHVHVVHGADEGACDVRAMRAHVLRQLP